MGQPDILRSREQSGAAATAADPLLQAVLGPNPAPITVLDVQFNMIWVNCAYARVSAREPDFFQGKNYFQLYPHAETKRIFEQVIETGVPHQADAESFECQGYAERGSACRNWSLVPILDEDGKVMRLVLTLLDVTVREQAIAALEDRAELFRTLVESQGEGTGIVDLDERFVFANPAAERILGVPPGTLVGRCLDEFVDSDQYALILAQTARRKQGQKNSYELQIVHPDGERRILFVTATPRYDRSGQLAGSVGVFLDVTEEVQTREALRQISQVLELRVEERTRQLLAANRNLESEISERRRAEEMLRQRNYELALLHRSTQAFNSVLDLNQVLGLVLEEVRHLLDATASSIWLVDPEGGDLICCQSSGRESCTVQGWRLAPGEGVVGWVARTGESLIVVDARLDDRHLHDIDRRTGLELPSILNVALRAKEEIVGVLQVLDNKPGRFSGIDLAVVEPLAISAATAIQNARLYQEAERLRAFNENIVQGMEEGILLGDREGKIAFINPSMARLLGYERDDLLGQHWTMLAPARHVGAASREMERLVESGPARFEGILQAQDGREIPAWVSTRPLLHEGEFQGLLAVFTDISERRQAEELLRRQNQELIALNAIAAAISETPDLDRVCNASLDRVIEMMYMEGGWIQLIDVENPRGALSLVARRGLKKEIVRSLLDLLPDWGWMSKLIHLREPVVLQGGEQACRGGSDWIEWLPGTMIAVPILAKGSVLGVLAVLSYSRREIGPRDVPLLTMVAHQIGLAIQNLRLIQRAAEIEVLRELDHLRSELIANVSHELRTPLGLIKILADTLLRQDMSLEPEMQREFLQNIDQETDRLEELVRNLLDISRIEEGRLNLDQQWTDLSCLAQESIQELRLQQVPHKIVLDLPSLVVRVDPQRMRQVLRNLLSNACKYSPNGGVITVSGWRQDRSVLVQVQDQGIGIAKQDLERVFERFYRVESDQTQGVSGVGLGLSVCRGIVEAHGGRIWAESTPGQGSVFSFVLPAGPVLGSAVCDRTTVV